LGLITGRPQFRLYGDAHVKARPLRKFGRRFAPDPRDHEFPLHAVLPRKSERVQRYWKDDYWRGNQGQTPRCVAYGSLHWLHTGPVLPKSSKKPAVTPAKLYGLAQQLDEFPGTDYDGSSVRGGIKALKQLGFVGSYHWARTLEDVVRCVLDVGPVIIGVNWYQGMCEPAADGIVVPEGELVGGHCVCLTGANRKTRRLRFLQSWEPNWGDAGHGYLSFEAFARLLAEQGEACLATEIGRAA
jgi:hypothetical protein